MSRLDEECIMAVVRNRSGIDSGKIDYSILVSRFENMSIVDIEDALKTLMVLEQRCRERIFELMKKELSDE